MTTAEAQRVKQTSRGLKAAIPQRLVAPDQLLEKAAGAWSSYFSMHQKWSGWQPVRNVTCVYTMYNASG